MAAAVATIAQLRRDQNLATTDGNVIYLPNNSGSLKIPPGGSVNVDTGYKVNTLPAGNRIILHPSAQVISRGGSSQTTYFQPQDEGTSIFSRIWNTTKQYITLENGIMVAKLIWQYLPAAMQILGLLVQEKDDQYVPGCSQPQTQVKQTSFERKQIDPDQYIYERQCFERKGRYTKKKRIAKL